MGGSLPVARHAVEALEELGHRVSWIDHSLFNPGFQRLFELRDPYLRNTVQGRLSETLGIVSLAHIADDPPDIALALAQAPLSLPVLQQLQRKKIVTAMWFVENYRHLTYWQQVAQGYDFWFVMQQQPCIDALKRAGAAHVTYLPLAANPRIHRPMACSDEERNEFSADVSFLGAGYRNRRLLLPELMNQGWSFKLWGNEWDDPGALGTVLQRGGARIDSETSVKIFNHTKVNVNLHSYTRAGFDPDGDSLNPRTFELAACGAFQIIDDRTLLPECFDASMLEIIRQPDELVPAVRRCLRDEAMCRAKAEASRVHALAHHTYRHRMQALLSEVGVHRPDRIGSVLQGQRSTEALLAQAQDTPGFAALLNAFPDASRLELKDIAEKVREKGPTAVLSREELLVLMMDEYRRGDSRFCLSHDGTEHHRVERHRAPNIRRTSAANASGKNRRGAASKMKQVLILNITRMGDLVQMTPLLSRLANEFPGVAIDLIVDTEFADIAALLPGIRAVRAYDFQALMDDTRACVRDVVTLYRELEAWGRGLATTGYDRVINLTFKPSKCVPDRVCRFL